MNYLNLNDEKLFPIVIELNTLLADYTMYYQKLRNFHWNIYGRHFFDLHGQFEKMYKDAQFKIDEIAERILTLRYHPLCKFSDYLKVSNIEEVTPLLNEYEMIKIILQDHSGLIAQMRVVVKSANAAGDEGTIDLIGGYIRSLEKTSWMLDAWTKESTIQTQLSSQQS